MNLNRIAAASQAAIGSALSGLQQGTVTSPYRFARALGHNTDLAHQRPATYAYLLGQEILGLDTSQPVASTPTGR
jgi:hypothetical protein